jgi:hypothetical protein
LVPLARPAGMPENKSKLKVNTEPLPARVLINPASNPAKKNKGYKYQLKSIAI